MANYNWDDIIENDGREYTILPEGDYRFKVAKFERGTCASGKNAGAKMAKLTLDIYDKNKQGTCYCNIILCDAFDWKISGFFRAIGAKKKGEKIQMNWNAVEGKEGRAHFIVGKDQNDHERNELDRFIDYDAQYFEADDGDLPF